MRYSIIIETSAERFIIKLPLPEKERVLKAIYRLPDESDIMRMRGFQNTGLYRLRVGEYRIIYSIDSGKLIVCVIDAGNRGRYTAHTESRGNAPRLFVYSFDISTPSSSSSLHFLSTPPA